MVLFLGSDLGFSGGAFVFGAQRQDSSGLKETPGGNSNRLIPQESKQLKPPIRLISKDQRTSFDGNRSFDYLKDICKIGPRPSAVSGIHCCVPGMSDAGTERAGRPAPTYKYYREIQRHWIEETKKLHESGKQWITSPSLPINTRIVFLPLNLITVDVIVLVTNTLNLF